MSNELWHLSQHQSLLLEHVHCKTCNTFRACLFSALLLLLWAYWVLVLDLPTPTWFCIFFFIFGTCCSSSLCLLPALPTMVLVLQSQLFSFISFGTTPFSQLGWSIFSPYLFLNIMWTLLMGTLTPLLGVAFLLMHSSQVGSLARSETYHK